MKKDFAHPDSARFVASAENFTHSTEYDKVALADEQNNLMRIQQQGNTFLYQIVVDDESWWYHYEPEYKRQRMQSKHAQWSKAKKCLSHPSAGIVMVAVFCKI